MAGNSREEVKNFSPGPAAIPTEVLLEAQKDALNYRGLGIGVMEMSHRSPEYGELNRETMDLVRSILKVPDNYEVIFLQGGGTGQFAAVPLNLTSGGDDVVDYIVTGTWSNKAAKEAEKYAKVHYVLPKTTSYTAIPPRSEWDLTPDAKYVYYTDNETVNGIEFPSIPDVGRDTLLVCDVSSNFITRPIDVSKYALLYAGVQKNMGCAGLTVVIVRKDLLGSSRRECPTFIDYTVQSKANSAYNTPNVWGVYIFNRVLKWVRDKGGVEAMSSLSTTKSDLLNTVIKASGGFYHVPVSEGCRSRVNVTFRVCNGNGPSADIEAKFIEEAKKEKFIHVHGHRSVGGMRASLYNAVTVENTKALVSFMTRFMAENNSEP